MVPKCGCGKKAYALVYDHEEPHCEKCVLEAIRSSEKVEVYRPEEWWW